MDAFYASVEQRDHPELRGKPLAVGHAEERGVVAAASYEARRYGVRSAMSSQKAKRLCPQLIFVSGRMDVYKSVSRQIHEIFHEYTDIIEPLSLDEAFSFTAPFLRSYAKSWSLFCQAHLIKQFFHLFHEWFVVNLGVVSEYQLVELRRGQRLEFSVQESRVTLHRVSH